MKYKSLFYLVLVVFVMAVFLSLQKKSRSNEKLRIPKYFPFLSHSDKSKVSTRVVELGRYLFYDTRLSGNNKISCASCHLQEFAFSDTSRFSIGVNGRTKRNSMALSNQMWQSHFFWDGRAHSLEEQALLPIQNEIEMNQPLEGLVKELAQIPLYEKLFQSAFHSKEITNTRIAIALAQFQRTMISDKSPFDAYMQGDSSALSVEEKRGYRLFMTIPNSKENIRGAGCVACHSTTLFAGNTFQNNGLDSVFLDKGLGGVTNNYLENGKFKIPSLRNIALTAPYMHDGRFSSIKEVLNQYNEHVVMTTSTASFLRMSNSNESSNLNLTQQELRSIEMFLHTLTDKKFITRKDLSNPFKKVK